MNNISDLKIRNERLKI
jgi:hypothetical protein